MRYYEKKNENPLLYEVSHTAWKYFGEKNDYNINKGFFEHAFLLNKVTKKLIFDILNKRTSAIIEGVHITPFLSLEIPKDIPIFILYISDRDKHFQIFDTKNSKRSIKNEEWYNNYENISTIQDKLVFLTKKFSQNFNNLHLMENKDIKTTIDKIISTIENEEPNRMRLYC
jgi:2-phosphoglycerate kinase